MISCKSGEHVRGSVSFKLPWLLKITKGQLVEPVKLEMNSAFFARGRNKKGENGLKKGIKSKIY